jgi:molybdopterin synthase catalytic subunit
VSVRVQAADFDLAAEVAQLRAQDPRVGAVVTFLGTVRDMNAGAAVAEMELEHYPGMTEQALAKIVEQAKARWPLYGALVVHRVGPLKPMEQIVLVACSAAHRGEAFALKTEAPFWKKEQTPGGARCVDARDSDEQARAKWGAL